MADLDFRFGGEMRSHRVPLRRHAAHVPSNGRHRGERAASLNVASELLGHTDPEVTIEHYIRRNEHVNPLTAELLDAAFARSDDGSTTP